MTRLPSMLLAVLLLALMGLARLPVPCLGDGAGHPCTVEQCACTSACSCKLSCEAMASDPHAACHMGGTPTEAPGHFTLPESPPVALAIAFAWPFAGRIAPPRPAALPSREAPFLSLAEPPPRLRA